MNPWLCSENISLIRGFPPPALPPAGSSHRHRLAGCLQLPPHWPPRCACSLQSQRTLIKPTPECAPPLLETLQRLPSLTQKTFQGPCHDLEDPTGPVPNASDRHPLALSPSFPFSPSSGLWAPPCLSSRLLLSLSLCLEGSLPDLPMGTSSIVTLWSLGQRPPFLRGLPWIASTHRLPSFPLHPPMRHLSPFAIMFCTRSGTEVP